MPSKMSYDPGRATFNDVVAGIHELLFVKSVVPLDIAEQVTMYGMRDFPTRQGWLERFSEWKARKLAWPPGMLAAWKQDMTVQWTAHVDVAGSDWAKYESLYTTFHPSRGAENFLKLNKMWYVKDLIGEGAVGIVTTAQGIQPTGSGKTDTALLLTEILAKLKDDQLQLGTASDLHQLWLEQQRGVRKGNMDAGDLTSKNIEKTGLYHAKGVHFQANIRVRPESPYRDHFTYVTRMSDLLEGTAEHGLQHDFNGWILDEAALFVNRKTPMRKENLYVEQLLTALRKEEAFALFCAQNAQRQLPPAVTIGSALCIEKISPRVGDFTIRGLMVAKRIRNIPGTSIRFRSKAFSNFAPDIDPVEMITVVTQQEQAAHEDGQDWSHEDTCRAIIAYIKEHRLTQEALAKGKGTQIPTQVKQMIGRVNRDTGRAYTLEEIVDEIAGDFPEMGRDEVREIAKGVVASYAKKRKAAEPDERKEMPRIPAVA